VAYMTTSLRSYAGRGQVAAVPRSLVKGSANSERRRVQAAWWLLFINVLGPPTGGLLHLPKVVAELLTQGALVGAVAVALTLNPRMKVRSNVYLSVFSLLAITSLMTSVRLVSVGTAYRGVRIALFVGVLWLLTPWWGRRDAVILKAQAKFLMGILGSVVLGLLVAPGKAMAYGRLGGVIWPIYTTQVAHYAADIVGIMVLLGISGLVRWRFAGAIAVIGMAVLVATHTRTALVACLMGLIVGSASLFTVRKRVRQAFGAAVMAGALVVLPLSPLIVNWLTRGETPAQLADLSGRTNFWSYVFSEQRPLLNEVLGDGINNGSINGVGLPIDSSWVEDYQDQGIAGDVLTGTMFFVLLAVAVSRPRGPARAIGLFLVVYCLVASFTEDGAGIASQYAMDLTVAASLLVSAPSSRGHEADRASGKGTLPGRRLAG